MGNHKSSMSDLEVTGFFCFCGVPTSSGQRLCHIVHMWGERKRGGEVGGGGPRVWQGSGLGSRDWKEFRCHFPRKKKIQSLSQ